MIITLLIFIASPATCQASSGPSAAQYGVVLNLAGKQRMLTQKMSKEVLLIARKIDVETNLNNLEATAQLFDKTLIGLVKGDEELNLPPTVNFLIKMQLDKVQLLWRNFYPPIREIIANKNVTDHQAWQIAEKNLQLLKETASCVTMYEEDAVKAGLKSHPNLAVSINLAGKQRMLIQKMSKEYLLIAYGHKTSDNQKILIKTYNLFERTLMGLINGDAELNLTKTSDGMILNQLYKVKGLWDKFKPIVVNGAVGAGSISTDQIVVLAKDNLVLLKEMNTVVEMYEKQAVN